MEWDPNLELTHKEVEPLLKEGINPAEWFTTRTLANYWGVDPNVVRNAAQAGNIPWVKYGRKAFFNKAAVLVPGSWWPVRAIARARAKPKEDGFLVDRPTARGVELLARIEESYLIALADNVTYEDWVSIVRTAVEAAKKGDWRSRKWIADYLLGTPVHRVAAEVDMGSRKGYSDDQRAAAVTALLELVRSRGEDEVIDVTGTPVTDGEEPS